ncbi:MAG: amidophosphoribosyltransferase, partial [Thermoanaerobaculia bacterium]
AQPIVVKTSLGPLGVVHNGNLTNAVEIREELETDGAIFQTTSDTEVILHLMARKPRETVVESLMEALGRVRGAYSLLLISQDSLIAVRDPHGFRPLVLGEVDGVPCFSSETCAFDLLGGRTVRELDPGEVVVARDGRTESYHLEGRPVPTRCAFEQVYFARPDSRVFGDSVAESRLAMGAHLAREAPVPGDLVVPVPDSGLFAALGYSRESGLPFEFGLIRNHYVGRTFIEPRQSIRHFGVRIKLNPVRELIEGRRVILVDDSIVRGTTAPKIVKMVRDAGATEVHVRISCPPTSWPCHYGIDMPTREELIASSHSPDEIRDFLGADSLAYLSLDGMLACLSGDDASYCTACWTGDYRVPISARDRRQAELFPIRSEEGEE